MRRRLHTAVSLTETNYQFSVVSSSDVDALMVHWDAHRDNSIVAEQGQVIVCKGRCSFLFTAFVSVMFADVVIIGDFRSAIQALIVCLCFFSRKKVVLAEDGLISQVADKYEYSFDAINDGGLRAWKGIYLKRLQKRLASSPRITTTPKYLRQLGKSHLIYGVSLAADSAVATQRQKFPDTVLFVGSNYSALGITNAAIFDKCEVFKKKFARYKNYSYVLHPRQSEADMVAERLSELGWNVYIGMQSVPEGEYGSVATINSTGVLSSAILAELYVLVRIERYVLLSSSVLSAQRKVRVVLTELLNCKNKCRVVTV